MMEKRTIIAIILSILVIVLWGIVKSEYFPEAPSKPETKEVRKDEIPNIEKIEKKVEKR